MKGSPDSVMKGSRQPLRKERMQRKKQRKIVKKGSVKGGRLGGTK
jgi:hypothetical protein